MNDFFGLEGPFFGFISKAGQIIIASILCLICMIPIVTIVPAWSALYYAVIKSVRRDRGYVHKEYFRSFIHCLPKGIVLSLIYVGIPALIAVNVFVANVQDVTYLTVYAIVIAALFASVMYLIPVLSRFNMKLKDMIKLSTIMSLKHFPTTLVLCGMAVIVVFLQIRVLTIVTLLFVPGTWVYFETYLMEKVLKKYMAKVSDDTNEDTWYLE